LKNLASYSIIIVDGQVASGKSTLVEQIRKATRSSVCSYKSLGFTNLFAFVLLKLFPGCSTSVEKDAKRFEPILAIDPAVLAKLSALFSAMEIFYKAIQASKVIVLAAMGPTVVDEFLAIRYANYVNMFHLRCLSLRAVRLLVSLDMGVATGLVRRRKVLYLFKRESLPVLEARWRRRGHTVPYDARYSELVSSGWTYYSGFLAKKKTVVMDVLGDQANPEPPKGLGGD
jgi:hypothetical protein